MEKLFDKMANTMNCSARISTVMFIFEKSNASNVCQMYFFKIIFTSKCTIEFQTEQTEQNIFTQRRQEKHYMIL